MLPILSFGLWHNFGEDGSAETGRAMVGRAFDAGITHFDLANNYGPPPGAAEEFFGRVLRSDLWAYRNELVITTKAGWDMWPGPYGDFGSRKYLLSSLEDSLARPGCGASPLLPSGVARACPDSPLPGRCVTSGSPRSSRARVRWRSSRTTSVFSTT